MVAFITAKYALFYRDDVGPNGFLELVNALRLTGIHFFFSSHKKITGGMKSGKLGAQ